MTAPDVWGVLLAAGASSRMGHHKLLLDVGGEPLVRRSARALLACDLAGVLVVLGRDPLEVRSALEGLPCEFTLNEAYARGELPSSVACALRALPGKAGGALLMLADMPFVRDAHLRRVLAASTANRPVFSTFAEVVAPPHFVPRAAFAGVLRAVEAGVPKPLPSVLGAQAERVAQPAEDLLDVDDERTYRLVLDRLAR